MRILILPAPYFPFQSAVIRIGGGRAVRLNRAEADFRGTRRNPMRMRLVGMAVPGEAPSAVAELEMSQQEAQALSEWLDAVVTGTPQSTPQK
jgi:hypothetical protein